MKSQEQEQEPKLTDSQLADRIAQKAIEGMRQRAKDEPNYQVPY
jgi:hypothetical protein